LYLKIDLDFDLFDGSISDLGPGGAIAIYSSRLAINNNDNYNNNYTLTINNSIFKNCRA